MYSAYLKTGISVKIYQFYLEITSSGNLKIAEIPDTIYVS